VSVVVSPAGPTHVEAVAALTQEMDRFYGATKVEPLDLRLQQIRDALFVEPTSARVLLAWDNEQLVGFASYSFLWPAIGLTRSLYLKELYVTETRRQTGAGKLLMRSILETALRSGCSRVEWTTDRDNVHAQQFYQVLGVSMNSSKLFYRLEGKELSLTLRYLASPQLDPAKRANGGEV